MVLGTRDVSYFFGIDGDPNVSADVVGQVKMDAKARVLELLADRPQDARGLSSSLGIPRNALFSLRINMEKEDLIVWNDEEWAVKPASDSRQNGPPDSSPSGG